MNLLDVVQTMLTVEQRNITSNIESKIDTKKNGNDEDMVEEEEIFDDAVEERNEMARQSREVSPLTTVLNIPSLTSQFLSRHKAAPNAVWQLSSNWMSQLSSSNNNLNSSWCQAELQWRSLKTLYERSINRPHTWPGTCINCPLYTRPLSSIKRSTPNLLATKRPVNWPVIYPKCSYKIMDPGSAALPQNLRCNSIVRMLRLLLTLVTHHSQHFTPVCS